ncbi:MAG: efflux RND transporter periplasmic adaptor subunit, partial [Bacteroidales bacterium]|nr:efflux RND transporter periplasmic adaptor subunit [Bacteroidales bacterium]
MNKLKFFAMVFGAAAVISACKSSVVYDGEGTFESTEVIVSAEAVGRILSFDVKEGDVVTAGQELGCIDTTQLWLTKQQILKNADALYKGKPDIAAQLQPLQEQLRSLQTEKARVERLLADGAATSKQLDDVNTQIDVTSKQIDAQKSSLENSAASIDAQIAALHAQVDQLNDQLRRGRIVSPSDGTILNKYAEPGEFAASGKALYKLADLSTVYLRAYLNLGQLADVELGQGVKVYADYGGGNVQEYDGTVTWISSKSEFTPKNIQTSNERE